MPREFRKYIHSPKASKQQNQTTLWSPDSQLHNLIAVYGKARFPLGSLESEK